MSATIDETGNRYGKLVVIGLAETAPKTAGLSWKCRCDCGREKAIKGKELRRGSTKSCGCSGIGRYSLPLPRGAAAQKTVLSGYKRGAKRRQIEWALSDTAALHLMQQPCHYCGSVGSNIRRVRRCNGEFTYNGIDRLDNDLGYQEGNVVSCCRRCNMAKGTMSKDDFEQMAHDIVAYRIGV